MRFIEKIIDTDIISKEIHVLLKPGSFSNSEFKQEFDEIKVIAKLTPDSQYDGFKLNREETDDRFEHATVFFSVPIIDSTQNQKKSSDADDQVGNDQCLREVRRRTFILTASIFYIIAIIHLMLGMISLIEIARGNDLTFFITYCINVCVPSFAFAGLLYLYAFLFLKKEINLFKFKTRQ